MTATAPRTDVLPAWTLGTPRLLAGLDQYAVLDLRRHLAVHGRLSAVGRDRLLGAVREVALAGRGGAGFPLAAKLDALAPGRPVVVVNGSESEPASWKDRTLLRRAPHLVLDGALAIGGAFQADRVIVVLHDRVTHDVVQRALSERPDGRGVEVRMIEGGFVSGEARAVVRALDGGPALPTGRRTLPVLSGVGGAPTLLSNVETFAQLAVLLRLGPSRYRDTGTHAEPGTTLLTVCGAVAHPGVVEIPIGTPLPILLSAVGGQAARHTVLGGYHGAWLPVSDFPLTRAGAASVCGTLGAGVLAVVDESTCALGELARVAAWLAAQSVQQCGPCRFGLPALAADVDLLWRGRGDGYRAALQHANVVTGRGACAHPDGAARFVLSALTQLRDEVEQHAASAGCGRPVHGQLPLPESQ